MPRTRISSLALSLLASTAFADTYPRQNGIDVLHYVFELTLSDDSDAIEGRTSIEIEILQDGVESLVLDLVNESNGRGMTVSGVFWGDSRARYEHGNDRLSVSLTPPVRKHDRRKLRVDYGGTPGRGLRIGENLHGDRTFFSDNWPNRARHWLPSVDHPYDKATGEMIVVAPAHYQVVSNGALVEETDLPDGRRRTHWKESAPIATWLYVLGVARFAVDHYDQVGGRPLSSWVYPQDREEGFHDFSHPTRQAFEFFEESIGPYVYEKLANVQSAIVPGAMESATALMYGQAPVTGKRSERLRDIIAHEIAHQWWGNAVTEADWDDVWLSEGFATYFTLLFREHAFGRDDFLRGLEESRRSVLEFHATEPDYRVVHDQLDDMEKVTTRQTYQKGAWVLHMLRGLVGDDAFWSGIRAYYARFVNGNATTDDFRRAMETASGRDLERFFRQWLYRGGIPAIEGGWTFENLAVAIDLRQTQPGQPFELSIPVGIELDPSEPPRIETLVLESSEARFTIPVDRPPSAVVLDPQSWVLMESSFGRRERAP